MNRRTFLLSTLAVALPIPLAAQSIDPKMIIGYGKTPKWRTIGFIHDTVIKEATRDLTYGLMDVPKGTRMAFYKGIQ